MMVPCGYCGTPDVFCPFSGSGLCPGGCPDNNHRACVDGEDDD